MRGKERQGSEEKGQVVKNVVIDGVILFLLCIFQTTVLGRWKIFGAVPDLMLCSVLLIGFCRGHEYGAVGGITAGIFSATLGTVGVTVAPVFYFLVGYLCGYFARTVTQKSIAPYLFFLAISLPFGAIETAVQAILTKSDLNITALFLHAILPESAGTFLCGAILFFPLKTVFLREKKRKSVSLKFR